MKTVVFYNIFSLFCYMYSTYEQQRPKPSGPFRLDDNYIDEIEKGWVRSDQWEKASAAKVNMEFLYSPLKFEEVNGVSYPAERLRNLIANTPTHAPSAGHNITYQASSPMQHNLAVLSPSPRLDAKLVFSRKTYKNLLNKIISNFK